MPTPRPWLAGFVLAAALPQPASAAVTGGAAAPTSVKVSAAVCADGQRWACAPGRKLTLRGDGLKGVSRVTFLGSRGRADDRVVRPVRAQPAQLVVVVPPAARSGAVLVHSSVSGDARAPRPVAIAASAARESEADPGGTSPTAPVPASQGTFPIDGRHDLGQTATNDFGGGRGHKGQDMFAACGTPLVAVLGGTVQQAASESRAGNYVVIQDAAGRSYVYMHMRARALVKTGDRVAEGQRVGYVGDTGDAEGCHLHFELWTAPGWYSGGRPTDPLPQLKSWHGRDGDH